MKALKTAEEQAAASDAYERAIEAKSLALKKEADAALAAARAQEELLSAEMSTIDTSFRLADATDQVAAAAARYNEEGGATAAGPVMLAKRCGLRRRRSWRTSKRWPRPQGQTLDAGQKQQILRDALSESAAKFPQFAEQAREMASALDGIPDGKSVDVSRMKAGCRRGTRRGRCGAVEDRADDHDLDRGPESGVDVGGCLRRSG